MKKLAHQLGTLVVVISALTACQHHPKNKVGKAYDADSARCIWGDNSFFSDRAENDLQANGHVDPFKENLDKQDQQLRNAKDCESSDERKRRNSTASLKAEIDKAIKQKK